MRVGATPTRANTRSLARPRSRIEPFVVSPMIATALIDDPALQARAIRDFVAQTAATRCRTGGAGRSCASGATRCASVICPRTSTSTPPRTWRRACSRRTTASRLTTFAYALDRDDGSAMRKRLRAGVRALARLARRCTDDAAAAIIAEDALDVLVDLKGHTQGSRLAHPRAPSRARADPLSRLSGHDRARRRSTRRSPTPIVVPPGDERITRSACFACRSATRSTIASGRCRPRRRARSRLAASAGSCSFRSTRPTSSARAVRRRLARRARASTTMPCSGSTCRTRLRGDNLRAAARARGVAPDASCSRRSSPQRDHLARLRCADLALDVLPYGSHTTGSDALWCGVPLLTLTGATFAGRVGTSLVHAVELPELAVDSDGRVSRHAARACARDRERLAGITRPISSASVTRAAVRHAERFTRDFEQLLEDAAAG